MTTVEKVMLEAWADEGVIEMPDCAITEQEQDEAVAFALVLAREDMLMEFAATEAFALNDPLLEGE